MIFLEYIWLDREGVPRSKIRVCHALKDIHTPFYSALPLTLEELGTNASLAPLAAHFPDWNFDGSSTDQHILANPDQPHNTEVVLKPVRIYRSPLDKRTLWVLCQLDRQYAPPQAPSEALQQAPVPGFNTRAWAQQIAEQHQAEDSWFGLEQEYTLLDPRTHMPYRWEESRCQQQGPFYCSVRYPYCQLPEMAREHLELGIQMGLKLNGLNAEVAPSQWEFQLGPADLLKAADDLIMARYLLFRLSARYKVEIEFHPKPMKGDWNGSGCHINFSTKVMREPGGMEAINQVVSRLEADHPKILKFYGKDNEQRLTGLHETSSMQTFSHGIGTRHTSVRIPNQVAHAGYGYIEDRRPASNIDPYLSLGKLLEVSLSED